MRKLLTAGIFGTILSLTDANYACASIISRGFFDEAMENYATTTALDLKANQSDLNFIGMEVDPELWNDQRESEVTWSRTDAAPIIAQLFPNFVESTYIPDSISGTLLSSLTRIDRPGIAGFTYKLMHGWTDGGGTNYSGLFYLSKNDRLLLNAYNSDNSASLFINGANATTIRGVDYTGPVYPLWKLSEGIDKIGDLPSGNFPGFPESEEFFSELKQPLTYPTSLAESIDALYGNPNKRGLLNGIIAGFRIDNDEDGRPDDYIGIIPNYGLAKIANDKIGTLPTEIIIGNSNGAMDMFNITKMQKVSLPKDYTLSDFIQDMYYGDYGTAANLGASPFYGLSDVIDRVMYGGIIGGVNPDLAGGKYKGLISLTREIGTLPSGNFPIFLGHELLFPELKQPLTYPTSLAELITAIYGNSETKSRGLLAAISEGFPFDSDLDGRPDDYIGLIPIYNIAKNLDEIIGPLPTEIPNKDTTWARYGFVKTTGTPIDLPDTIGGMFAMLFNDDGTYNGLSLRNIMVKILMGFDNSNGVRTEGLDPLTSAYNLTGDSPIVTAVKANATKIGDLPSGNFPHFPGIEYLLSNLNHPHTYPTSLAELITAIYGDMETGAYGLLKGIIMGFPFNDTDGNGSLETSIGLMPNYHLATNANDLANANTAKIGTLPTGYDNVGAALTAMKSDIDAKNLPSTSDDGQYVLTAKKVGDTITYTWVKMDLTNEEQAQ